MFRDLFNDQLNGQILNILGDIVPLRGVDTPCIWRDPHYQPSDFESRVMSSDPSVEYELKYNPAKGDAVGPAPDGKNYTIVELEDDGDGRVICQLREA